MEQSRAAPAKQLRMVQFVTRMEQKEPPQQRIRRHLGGAHQIAPPSASVSAKRSSLRARRVVSSQIHLWTGRSRVRIISMRKSSTFRLHPFNGPAEAQSGLHTSRVHRV
jgi:hypothetical protein